ncbi:hypothetical protein [Streptomyces sp. NPDC102264]|uniref:hypothetical protein n=1 Tax=Streptomyces sp. NPDC102264 TaxID=3366149 RepID=UPI00381AD515
MSIQVKYWISQKAARNQIVTDGAGATVMGIHHFCDAASMAIENWTAAVAAGARCRGSVAVSTSMTAGTGNAKGSASIW